MSRNTQSGHWPEVEAHGAADADVRWLVSDQLGTPRMVVDKSGSLSGVTRHDYLPFGEELYAGAGERATTHGYGAADNVRQKFTSKERDDETQLDYFLARYYSSTQGRFTSPDEFKGGTDELFVRGSGHKEKQALPYAETTNPQTLNKYQYCLNNPLRYTDQDGHVPQERLERELRRDEEAFGAGKISAQEYLARARARGAGAAAALAILAAIKGGAPVVYGWEMGIYSYEDAPAEIRELLARARSEGRDPEAVCRELAQLGVSMPAQMMYLRDGLSLPLEQAKRFVLTGNKLEDTWSEEMERAVDEEESENNSPT